MMHPVGGESTGGPGRPRSPELDEAIIAAAVDLLVEEGFQAMTIEGIAARAGVGKTTIYRRWSSKEDLVIAAIETLSTGVDVPDTGSVQSDMFALIESFRRQAGDSIVLPAMSHVLGVAVTHPEILDAFREQILLPRHAAMRQILQRGMERGEVRSDIDVDFVTKMFPATIFYGKMFETDHEFGVTDTTTGKLVDTLWRGIVMCRSSRNDTVSS